MFSAPSWSPVGSRDGGRTVLRPRPRRRHNTNNTLRTALTVNRSASIAVAAGQFCFAVIEAGARGSNDLLRLVLAGRRLRRDRLAARLAPRDRPLSAMSAPRAGVRWYRLIQRLALWRVLHAGYGLVHLVERGRDGLGFRIRSRQQHRRCCEAQRTRQSEKRQRLSARNPFRSEFFAHAI